VEAAVGGLDRSEIIWRKSEVSADENCVEVAFSGDLVLLRDSKDPSGAVLSFNQAEWTAFLAGARDGTFDVTA
jgi:Domain of unknown function (DUF397)